MAMKTVAGNLFAASALLAAALASASLAGAAQGAGEEKKKPTPGPLSPVQAGPRKAMSTGMPSELLPHKTGTIRSLTDTQLVLSFTHNGKKARRSFGVTPETAKEGELKPGARATVYYESDQGKRVAKRIVAAATTSAPAKSKN